MENNNKTSRRKFIKLSALATGVSLINPVQMFAQSENETKNNQNMNAGKNIKTRGYVAKNENEGLELWNFERRPLGDNDILIDIKYSGICHSDIHNLQGHWGKQIYPQVAGHEIAGIVTAVGKNVTKFKVGDKAGVGCMVNSCRKCDECKNGQEQYCEQGMTETYGTPDPTSPTGVTQGGYSNNIVVTEHFAIRIPETLDLKHAAPLLCAGITTYSPLMKAKIRRGDKIGVVGIGGLGHLAIKLAVEKGAEVYAFTTSPSKVNDIKQFGAKEIVVVDNIDKLNPYKGKLDFMISTVPYAYEVADYISCVKPYGYFSQVGMPINGELVFNNFKMFNRVHYSV